MRILVVEDEPVAASLLAKGPREHAYPLLAIVLQGQFQPVQEEDDDIERKAIQSATGADADASGEAEVEYPKDAPSEQEVEFSVENLQPGATFTLVIDGQDVATTTTDREGKAEIELTFGQAADTPR
jgi:hypothetical protein